jgi:tRNA threonylcarbamoyladenosine biosynthesis protein TsaE
MKKIILIENLDDLRVFSSEISKFLKPGSILLIFGDIGSGKTTLVKMIADCIGLKENVNSPTFNILKSYWIENQKCFLNHFDFFNLKNNDNISFFEDIKLDNINIIEWPEMNRSFWLGEKMVSYVKIFFVSQNKRLIKYSC